jgi:4-amino-4-deoxy-L-arabinose transferase-like glycosyltransferase
VFSVAATKLPNYILPLYPAVALLTARFLDGWRTGDIRAPALLMYLCMACLALIGAGVTLGLLLAGGAIELPLVRGRSLAGLEDWAALGLVLVLGGAAAAWCLRRQWHGGAVGSVVVSVVLVLVPLAAWGSAALDRHKAPRPLVELAGGPQRRRDLRIGCFQLEHLPSLNFYCQRTVSHCQSEQQALELLRYPLPVYLFVPEPAWAELQRKVETPYRVLGRHRDLYRGGEVVVVRNW